MRRWVMGVLLVVVSCRGRATVPHDPSVPLLAHVPADTPYVVSSSGQASGFFDPQVLAAFDQALLVFWNEIEAAAKDGDPATRFAVALAREARGKLASPDGLRELGLDPAFPFVLYGIDAYPVLRLRMVDGTRFLAAIERAQKASDFKLPTAISDQTLFWYAVIGETMFAAAVIGNDLVVTLVPTDEASRRLPVVFGRPPRRSLDPSVLDELRGEFGLSPALVGYLDTRALFATVASSLSPACKKEIGGLLALAPRAIFGQTARTATSVEHVFVIELDKTVAAELAHLTRPIPAPTDDQGTSMTMAFTIALDGDRLLALLRRVTARVRATPYACERLRDLKSTMAELDEALSTPEADLLRGFGGVYAEIGGLNDKLMLSGRATHRRARELVNLWLDELRNTNPALKTFLLDADGKPVRLPPAITEHFDQGEGYVALTEDTLVFAGGSGAEASVRRLLDVPLSEPGVVVRMRVNGTGQTFEDSLSHAEEAKLRAMMSIWADWKTTMALYFTETGIELHMRGTFGPKK